MEQAIQISKEMPNKTTTSFRLFQKEADYPVVYKWWKKHNAVPLAPELLSDLGVVYQQNEQPEAMTWVFLSNSKGAQIGWTVVNPDLGAKSRMVAVSRVLAAAEQICIDRGCLWAISFSDDSSLSKLMSFQGFTPLKTHEFLIKQFAQKEAVHADRDV